MIIKVYEVSNKIAIYEDVTDVRIHCGTFVQPINIPVSGWGPDDGYIREYVGEGIPKDWLPQKDEMDCKIIDFTSKDGYAKRLTLFSHAYVCNDSGKTIEKVSVA